VEGKKNHRKKPGKRGKISLKRRDISPEADELPRGGTFVHSNHSGKNSLGGCNYVRDTEKGEGQSGGEGAFAYGKREGFTSLWRRKTAQSARLFIGIKQRKGKGGGFFQKKPKTCQ